MVNWTKIIANAGVAFATTLGGLITFNSWAGLGSPVSELIIPALIVGGIQAVLAFFVSLQEESQNRGNPAKKKGTSVLTLF